MNHYYDNDDDDDEEEEEAFIDPNDLIMINNPDSWEPSQEQIEVYATQLGIDPANSPPEAMEIAYKYLKQKIPPDWIRAFTKENPQMLYIDMKTNEIHLTTDIEESAKEEYLELMNDYREKLKQEEEDAKKVKVVHRTKIPPIGAKKVQENQRQEREKKFIDKQIENDIQYRKNKMEQEDLETKNLTFEIKKKEKSDSEIIENLVSKINDLEFSDKNKEKKNDILNIVDEIKNRLNKKNKEIDELKNNINKKKENENNENENNKNIEIILNNKQNNQTNTTKLILPNSNPMNKLLKTLIENNYINIQKVLNCMLQVDRKDFTNTNPYKDQPQYVSHKASISAPHMHAFALEKLSPFLTEGINVLDIGSGTGYL